MIHGTTNSVITFGLTLAQGEVNQYPQVKIYDAHDNLDATVDLVHVADGYYSGAWTPNTSEWHYGNGIIYTDAIHTVESTVYGRRGVVIKIDEVETNIDDIETDTNELQTDWTNGGRLDLILDDILLDTGTTIPATITTMDGKIDVIDGIVDNIIIDTAEIGVAGVGLSNIPWNATWDAEVQSECADALIAYDPPTRTEATSDKDEIIVEVDANETKIDIIDGVVDAILADTVTIDWTNITDILADTNELQTDWTNGGRLDLIIDDILLDTGTTLPATLTTIEGKIDTIDSIVDTITADVKRVLGLSHENIYIDTTIYDAWGNLSSARLRVYSVAGSVGTGADVLSTYTITANGTGTGKFTYWKQVKV